MSSSNDKVQLKVLRGSYVVKFDFEDLEECLGSYDLEELSNGEERVRGYKSIGAALEAGQAIYADDPDGPAAFEVLDYRLQVVETWHPPKKG